MGLSTRLSTGTSTIVHFVSSIPLTVYSLFNFAYVLRMSWCACCLGNLHFFYLMYISILGISDVVNVCFREHTFSDFI